MRHEWSRRLPPDARQCRRRCFTSLAWLQIDRMDNGGSASDEDGSTSASDGEQDGDGNGRDRELEKARQAALEVLEGRCDTVLGVS